MIELNGRCSIAMFDYQRVSGRAKPSRSIKKKTEYVVLGSKKKGLPPGKLI